MDQMNKLEKFKDVHQPCQRDPNTCQDGEEAKVNPEPISEDDKGDASTQDEKSEKSDSEEEKFACATELLEGLKNLNMKIYLMSEEISLLVNKPKFQNLFDIAVIGYYHAQDTGDKFPNLLKKSEGIVYIELLKYFIGIKSELKEKCYEKQIDITTKAGLKMLNSPYVHHYLFGFHGEKKEQEDEKNKT